MIILHFDGINLIFTNFRFSKQNMRVLTNKLALLFSIKKNITFDRNAHRRYRITANHLNGGKGRIQAIISTVV